jgi:hypothetical protein
MSSTVDKIPIIPFQKYLLEILQDEALIKKPPTTKEILSKRKNTFIKEYLEINNIAISSTCSVKTETVYKTGHLILSNNKLIIHQYDSNKTDNIHKIKNSITQTIDIFYPIFFIDFNMVTCELVIHKKKQKFRLIILGKNLEEKDYENNKDYIYKYRIVKFKMPYESKEVFKLICENINKSIILSNGYKSNIFGINIRNNFCKEYFINHKKFVSVGNTGDILLFKGHSTESQLQRLITSDDYDHVGILIKNKDGLNVYESTGSDGVKLRPWHEFITYYWYLLYDVMAFRKLKVDIEAMKQYITGQNDNIKMNDIIDNDKIKEMFYYHFNKKVEKFIEQTENKKYVFSKIGYFCTTKMKKNSIIRKSYSCSELIAALYYYIGIITDTYEARNYLPGHFAKKGIIPFKKGFSLSEEYIIDFSSSFFIQN